ncbi:hypothetical protein [Winslowiella iniecta]|uniref:Uncharacterized protein n=1 Tax=Winslowiella iniecta TaxID=1560201 RepID=A0A0L7T621_9GAMM|nr:hypothetical protein [Winslowiella iniecta]KOC90656.1 hypothetical protein NG42_08060 [Winslowiella iniecta]KOC93082.1 hypothetical protein NG43_11925 [Winslowiella iniecta]
MKPKSYPLLPALIAAGLLALSAAPAAFAEEEVVATDLEPLHHVIMENQYVTVMRVMIRPGESTQFHEQHLDYVNTHVNGSKVQISYPDKPVKDHEMKSGNVKFGAHQGKSEKDKVTNVDTTLNHQVSFEIKQNGPQNFGGATRPDSPAFKQVLDEKTVRGWKVTLQPGENTAEYTQHGPGVRVFFTEGRLLVAEPGKPNRVKEIWLHRGDAMLIDPGKIQLSNGGETPLIFNDYELL